MLTHWGTQYTHRPESSQRIAARAFADAGADLVIGGHPHWVQGLEMAGSAVVVHSLGNFIFDMDFQTKTREGIFLEIVLWDGAVKAVEPVPYVIDNAFTPRLIRGDRAKGILERRVAQQPRTVCPVTCGQLRVCNQAHTVRPTRSSWRRSTTRGTSPREW